MLANHNERISQGGQDFNPVSGVLPMDLDETVIKPVSKRRTEQPARRVNPTVTSLEDFRTSGNKMYNGRVHVTGVAGASVDSPHDMRKLCRSSNYRFALRLSDGTAGLMAMVPDVCGRQFFGMPAAEACGSHSRSAFETLSHRIRQREDLVVDIRKVVVDGATYYILNTVSGV